MSKDRRCRLCRNARANARNKAQYRKTKNGKVKVYGKNGQRVRDSELQMTYDEYNQRLEKQKGLCAICGRQETAMRPETGEVFALSADHDHQNQMNRGLLCNRCNRAIGWFDDNPELVERARNYLLYWQAMYCTIVTGVPRTQTAE